MPKLFDLIDMPDGQNKYSVPLAADFKIPDTIQFVDNQTQEQFNKNLKEYNLEDLKLTARKRLILIDSESDKQVQEPPQSVQEIKHIDPMWSGTTSTVIDGNTISSGTSFSGSPAMPVVKRKKSDRPVVVSIKDQMKKKARRKLAAASRRKNR
jgi:hypothetical protein